MDPKEVEALRSYSECAFRQREKDGKEVLEVLVVGDPYNVTGDMLRAGLVQFRPVRPALREVFLPLARGAAFLAAHRQNLPDKVDEKFTRKLGIILDGELYLGPVDPEHDFRATARSPAASPSSKPRTW